jgi:CheY-like chemotaxis protein
VFEEFYQVRAALASRGSTHGMGLGLAIVRRLAALLGHEVELASQVDRGSRFTVLAPRVRNARRGATSDAIRPAAKTQLKASRRSLAGSTVVVIDDDPASLEAMRALFDTLGALAAGGESADAALAALGRLERYPDLIVADLWLDGGASGLDAIARLRDELGRSVPAIVVSGDTSVEAVRSVRLAGLSLLAKPVVPGALEAAAAALVASAPADSPW